MSACKITEIPWCYFFQSSLERSGCGVVGKVTSTFCRLFDSNLVMKPVMYRWFSLKNETLHARRRMPFFFFKYWRNIYSWKQNDVFKASFLKPGKKCGEFPPVGLVCSELIKLLWMQFFFGMYLTATRVNGWTGDEMDPCCSVIGFIMEKWFFFPLFS